MKDYSKLEKETVDYTNGGGETVECLVVGCDPDIGTTLVAKDNNGRYVFCSHGPLSPRFKGIPLSEGTRGQMSQVFKIVIKGIKKGSLKLSDFDILYINCGTDASRDTCAFGQ